jgi:PTS system nitrogen regulatory IIA component
MSTIVQSYGVIVLSVRKMQLTVKDVAKFLNVNEKTIYRWLQKGTLPASQVNTKGLFEALTSGGIYYRIEGDNKESALKNVVGLMRLPQEVDRDFLLQVLLAREAIASTAVGDGIAIPHVRNPIVLHVTEPIVSLCFLEKPIDFGSLDGKPVTCLFTLVSPTVKAHLYLLSRLAFALRDEGFRSVIEKQGARDEIYAAVSRVEAGLKESQPAAQTGGVS